MGINIYYICLHLNKNNLTLKLCFPIIPYQAKLVNHTRSRQDQAILVCGLGNCGGRQKNEAGILFLIHEIVKTILLPFPVEKKIRQALNGVTWAKLPAQK